MAPSRFAPAPRPLACSRSIPVYWPPPHTNPHAAPQVDLNLLKLCTKYEGFTEESTSVQLLWQALESFNHDERSLFLRFVWGRSRLPLLVSDFESKFLVRRLRMRSAATDPNDALPVSHTCFFQVTSAGRRCVQSGVERHRVQPLLCCAACS